MHIPSYGPLNLGIRLKALEYLVSGKGSNVVKSGAPWKSAV